MARYNHSYLVCKESINEVKKFLSKFFKEQKTQYTHSTWITFRIPKTSYTASLMKGKNQKITQNMVFEISCESLGELKKFSNKFKSEIMSFVATETGKPYRYYYIAVGGPKNICKIEVNYIQHLKK